MKRTKIWQSYRLCGLREEEELKAKCRGEQSQLEYLQKRLESQFGNRKTKMFKLRIW